MTPTNRGIIVGEGGLFAGLLVGWLTSPLTISKSILILVTSFVVSLFLLFITKPSS